MNEQKREYEEGWYWYRSSSVWERSDWVPREIILDGNVPVMQFVGGSVKVDDLLSFGGKIGDRIDENGTTA